MVERDVLTGWLVMDKEKGEQYVRECTYIE